tara:strand:- start:11304 stop:11501 length:198 start_codon:yes stop_codon:yes gene_type:complete
LNQLLPESPNQQDKKLGINKPLQKSDQRKGIPTQPKQESMKKKATDRSKEPRTSKAQECNNDKDG